MTIAFRYRYQYAKVKYYLNSYRALSDGKSGIADLENYVLADDSFLSLWKVKWIGTCVLLRTAVDLFRLDKESCINKAIREQIENEWEAISENKDEHPIFWEFLRKERNNIAHKYKWNAYEVWMDDDGSKELPPLSLLRIKEENKRSVLIMKNGYYQGRDSLELLKESAEWVEDRIFSAIRNAGFSPEEERRAFDFKKRGRLNRSTTVLGATK